jgi:hypothetical protein
MFTLVCPECDNFSIDVVIPVDCEATLVIKEYGDGTADYHQDYEAVPDHKVTVTKE